LINCGNPVANRLQTQLAAAINQQPVVIQGGAYPEENPVRVAIHAQAGVGGNLQVKVGQGIRFPESSQGSFGLGDNNR
jgi:hypothetical protein